jgi:flagellar basal body-associated protein FliL
MIKGYPYTQPKRSLHFGIIIIIIIIIIRIIIIIIIIITVRSEHASRQAMNERRNVVTDV